MGALKIICLTISIILVGVQLKAQSQQEVLQVQANRFKAMIEIDIAELENILADDLTYTHTTGTSETKAEFLSILKSQVLEYKSIEPRDSEVCFYGGVAVVTGISDMRVVASGKELSFAIRFIEVYSSTDDSWQLVAWQSTRQSE